MIYVVLFHLLYIILIRRVAKKEKGVDKLGDRKTTEVDETKDRHHEIILFILVNLI